MNKEQQYRTGTWPEPEPRPGEGAPQPADAQPRGWAQLPPEDRVERRPSQGGSR